MNKPNNNDAEYHVASYIVQVTPKNLAAVKEAISSTAGTEIHAETEQGKLVLTIEGASHQVIAKKVDFIQDLTGVNSLAQVYHQYTSE